MIVTQRSKIMRAGDRYYVYLSKKYNDIWRKLKEKRASIHIVIYVNELK